MARSHCSFHILSLICLLNFWHEAAAVFTNPYLPPDLLLYSSKFTTSQAHGQLRGERHQSHLWVTCITGVEDGQRQKHIPVHSFCFQVVIVSSSVSYSSTFYVNLFLLVASSARFKFNTRYRNNILTSPNLIIIWEIICAIHSLFPVTLGSSDSLIKQPTNSLNFNLSLTIIKH